MMRSSSWFVLVCVVVVACLTTTPVATASSLQIFNIEECLQCTEVECWFCESDQVSSSDGKPTRYCHCDPSHRDKPPAGYCGAHTYADFKRYAVFERECIGQAQPPLGQEDQQQTVKEEPEGGGSGAKDAEEVGAVTTAGSVPEETQPTTGTADADEPTEIVYYTQEGASIGLLVTLVLLFCCIGYSSGCVCMFALCKMKREQEEEEKRERASLMKVVTARDAYEKGSLSTRRKGANSTVPAALDGDII